MDSHAQASKGSNQTDEVVNASKNGLRIAKRGTLALRQLLDAYEYAGELNHNIWDFAIEIDDLRRLGLSNSDLRWLLCKGFVAQGREYPPEGKRRTVLPSDRLTFSRRTCFIALDSGVEFIRYCLSRMTDHPSDVPPARVESPRVFHESPRVIVSSLRSKEEEEERNGKSICPKWNRDRQELSVGNQVVKQFKVPAPNQELILSVFQEEGWPVRIDDPLPPHPQQDPKRRLHDTINSLNRRQKIALIRFSGDGKGRGVRWEFITPGPALERTEDCSDSA